MFTIVHIDISLLFRGGQRQVFLLHKGLLLENKKSFLITDLDGDLYKYCLERQIECVIGIKIIKNIPYILNRVIAYPKLYSIIKEIKPTHIHFHEPDSLLFGLLLAKKYILVETRRVSTKIKKSSIYFKYKNINIHVGVSNTIKNYLEVSGLKNVFHIPSSIDLSLFKDANPISILKNKKQKNILYIGSFTEMKGVDILLNALPRVIQVCPEFHLHLVGFGKLYNEYLHIIDKLKISQYITFYGKRSDTESIYKEVDFVVVPSRKGEGSNGILKESLASGKLPITSDMPENKEIITDGVNGIIFENENVKDLSIKIIDVLQDKYSISKNDLKKSVEKFDYKYMVQSYINIYEKKSTKKEDFTRLTSNEIKKITLISYDNWGYNEFIVKEIRNKGYEINHINFHNYLYKYPNFLHKVGNFITKTFLNYNIKREHYNNMISKDLENMPKQDIIICIKADFLSIETIKKIKIKANKTVLFINDSISRYPKSKTIIPYFDDVYSFEKKDCIDYNIKFKTNFIYPINYNAQSSLSYKYKVFNICSIDHRFNNLGKIAKSLKQQNISYKIIVCSKKNISSNYLEIIKRPLHLDEVIDFTSQSQIILDIHRKKQKGLSFRVFESLALEKKLITTNKDIINYDFYNPNNIFIITNIDDIKFNLEFINTTYLPIPKEIKEKYELKNWIDDFL